MAASRLGCVLRSWWHPGDLGLMWPGPHRIIRNMSRFSWGYKSIRMIQFFPSEPYRQGLETGSIPGVNPTRIPFFHGPPDQNLEHQFEGCVCVCMYVVLRVTE